MINGTLEKPTNATKGIIFLHSSERSHRDEDYFPQLSEYLKEHGIATFRYDSPKNSFLQSFKDRKDEAVSIYNNLTTEYPEIKWGFQGLSEGAVISILASRELPESFIIPASLELRQYSVEKLIDDISTMCGGKEDEVFLAKVWFDFYKLKSLENRDIDDFTSKNGNGPWTPILESRERELNSTEMLELTTRCFNSQKEEFGEYLYMDFFLYDIFDNNLDVKGFEKNLELWKEFTEVDPLKSLSDIPTFMIWGEKDDEVDIDKNLSLVEKHYPNKPEIKVYPGLSHGLYGEESYSEEMFRDIKDWIENL